MVKHEFFLGGAIVNWRDLTYLLDMGEVQKSAYVTLKDLDIFSVLKDYDPVLVGTIPLDINIEGSDLDIVCHVKDLGGFESLVKRAYGHLNSYTSNTVQGRNGDVCVINFYTDNFEIELYAQNVPSSLQNAYRHMDIEYRVLELASDTFKVEVVSCKSSGLKTEPTFAKLLNLSGDPYQALLDIETLETSDLIKLLKKCGYAG